MTDSPPDIAEAAGRAGSAPSALRFHEKKGLIAAAGRDGLRRAHHPDVLERLALIVCAAPASRWPRSAGSSRRGRPTRICARARRPGPASSTSRSAGSHD